MLYGVSFFWCIICTLNAFDLFRSFLLSFDQSTFFSWFLCFFAKRMMKYRIEITETLSRTIETEADSEETAVEKVRQMYRKCDIILDASDYVQTEISVKR